MNIFIGKLENDITIKIEQEEALHIQKSLRKKVGDLIYVTNGNQQLYRARIETFSKNFITAIIINIVEHNVIPSMLSLAICPTKQNDRTEWMIEKCVELGVIDFYFIESKHTERNKINVERWQKIANSAMKQSLRIQFPVIHPLIKFDKFIEQIEGLDIVKVLAYCGNEFEKNNICTLNKKNKTIIFIGPEGDFTLSEIDFCRKKNFNLLDFGNARLRSETASTYVASYFM
jgi:16S rRNA (uracil1498-N3)-methyltransferase